MPNLRKSLRKNKRAWRKNIDLDAIENGLEVNRNERIALGKVHDEVEPEALFREDTAGSEALRQEARKIRKLKIDEILTPQSKVPALLSKVPSSSALNVVLGENAMANGGICKALKAQVKKTASRLKNIEAQRPVKKIEKKPACYDIWDADDSKLKNEAAGKVDLTEKLHEVAREAGFVDHMKPVPVKTPYSVNKPTPTVDNVPAVRVVASGASYNPSAEAHSSLITQAIEEELARLSRIEFYQSKLTFETAEYKGIEEDMLVALSSDDDSIPSNSAGESGAASRASMPQRKTTAQRNKQKRHRQKLFEEWRAKQQRALLAQIDKLQKFKAELEASGAWTAAQKELEDSKGKLTSIEDLLAGRLVAEASKRARLGPHKFKEDFVAVQLSEDLAGTFRELKPEGNLLADRFRSLQERQLIETRVRVGKQQRYKRKKFEIPSYRFWDKKQMKFHDKS